MKKLVLYLCLVCLSFTVANAQTITGVITGADDGAPLPGVNIMIKGTDKGTITDMDGKYTIESINAETVLIFSYVGYTTQEITVGAQTSIDVSLQPGEDLGEVVVVGYGVKKKSLVTGAISSIDGDDLSGSQTYVTSAIQGKTSGVTILPSSGAPGSSIKVRIRGTSSNGKSDPLYIVDGVKMDNIDFLDPNDVESIEVLKDGASAAIYGAEGGNGVMMITTKKGKPGKAGAAVNYSYQYGIQSAPELPKLLDANDYGTYLNQLGTADAGGVKANTDWLDEIFEDAPMQKHYISIAGGTDKSSVMASMSYLTQDGILGGNKSNYERITGRLNAELQAKKWLKVGMNMGYTHSSRKNIPEDNRLDGVIGRALLIDPYTPVVHQNSDLDHIQGNINSDLPLTTNSDGQYYGVSRYVGGETVNPITTMKIANGETLTDQLSGNGYLKLDILEGLSFTTRLGVNYMNSNNHFFNKPYYYSLERNVPMNNATVEDQTVIKHGWQWENFFNYDKTFNKHNIGLVAGYSREKRNIRNIRTVGGSMVVPESSFAEIDYTLNTSQKVDGSPDEIRIMSYFGRVSYGFANKYLFEASIRRDGAGTSRLPDGSNWGTFPSISAGWVISEEDFWSVDAISFFKLRTSYGENGSLSNIDYFKYTEDMVVNGTKYPTHDGSYVPVWEAETQGNPDLTWETSQQINAGLDLRFLEGKASFSFDYFKKTTQDLLTIGSPVVSAGEPSPFINAGDVENSGLEFEIGYQNREGDFKYGINANLTTLSNEVVNVNENITLIQGTKLQPSWESATALEEGEPIWYFRGYETEGFDANGNVIIKDVNEDGSITTADKTNIGDPHPDFLYGFNINLEYKGFDLNIAANGSYGNEVLLGWVKTDRPNINIPQFMFDGQGTSYPRWDKVGDDYADPNFGQAMQSDLMVHDGSYLRIRQISLGYSLPKTILNTIKLSSVRIGVSLENYFTFTKYEGMDPEAGSVEDNVFNQATSQKLNHASEGIDRGVYPLPKTILFNLNIGF